MENLKRMRQSFSQFVMLAVLTSTLMSGCAQTPKKSGFLESYSGMAGQHDLDQVRVAPEANLTPYDTLVIGPIDAAYLSAASVQGVDRDRILQSLEDNFRKELSPYFKNVVADSSQVSGAGHAIRLEVAVTELQPTNVAKNLIWGFGVGNATAGIEGRIVDTKTGQEIMAFADRKKGSPFTKKEFNSGMKFPNWSELQYLYLFTEIWPENVGNLVNTLKK